MPPRVPAFGRAFAPCLVLALLCGSAFAIEARTAVKTHKSGILAVCLYPGFAPFVSKDEHGQWVGWDVSYLEDFAKQEKLTFQPVEVKDFNGIWNLPGKDEFECDIAASGISDTADRRKETGAAGDWSDHYYRVVRAFVVRYSDRDKLDGICDLRGKKVIVTGNSTANTDLVNRLKFADIKSVTIETTTNEEDAAKLVRDGLGPDAPFAYGGGLGSVQLVAAKLGCLSVVWPHCNMLANGEQADEPFSFVVRHADTGLADALNKYIAHPTEPYEGGPGPDMKCPPAP